MPFGKEDKLLIKSLYECITYNARLLVKLATVDRRRASASADTVCTLIKTSTQLSRCCWVRKTNLIEKLNSQRNFTWGGGIHQLSVSRIIHKDLRLKCCKKRRAQQLTEAPSMQCTRYFQFAFWQNDNVITSKPTWRLAETCKLYSRVRVFWNISAK